ncbi:MAG: arylsulfatase family protein [Verrucomicrobiaceae bacterium]|nr:arylsulfatase family protein [Verrucomicrobiaceae bacterium]
MKSFPPLLTVLCALLLLPPLGVKASASEPKRPNILFIIFDDLGWQHVGAYGCHWVKTPNFDRVAREGVKFTSAFTSNPKCSPCRATALTGRNTWQLEQAVSHFGYFPANYEVYPDLLEKAGYTVGLTGKGWGPGDFKTLAKRTRNPAGPSFDQATLKPPTTGIARGDYAKNFETFLAQRDKAAPFCFWMGFHEPHRPYELHSGERLGKKLEEVTVPSYLPDVRAVRGDLADYSIEVEWADGHIGRALEALQAAGELDNTIVVVTSDHGMPFPYVKGQIHEDGFHIPMAVRWPGVIQPGRVVDDLINIRDLAPTFMEAAGLKPGAQMTGHSLLSLLHSPKSGWVENRDVMLMGKERHDIGRPHDLGYPVRAIRTKDFLYVHNFNPERWPACDPETNFGNCDDSPSKEVLKLLGPGNYFYELSFGKRQADELYQLATDPEGVHNLANDLFYGAKVAELRDRMMAMLKEDKDPRALGQAAVFDTYPYVGSRAKGYETWLKQQDQKLSDEAEARSMPLKGGKEGREVVP